MIGAVPLAGRSVPGRMESVVRCAPGSLLLLYTDGLTDVAGEDADMRTRLLEETVVRCGAADGVERLVDAVLAACVPDGLRDDVAVLAVRMSG